MTLNSCAWSSRVRPKAASKQLVVIDRYSGIRSGRIVIEAELDTALGAASVEVDINPWVYTLGVGYRF